ncbi:MAG: response regulator [Proteobacteria bacterium]|nr:response regulator [Pseudomonadota bacterium]
MRKILIVDDDPASLKLLEVHLRFGINADHDVISAGTGLEAWELLQKHQNEIDVILLDRRMPVMSGDEFMRKHNQDKTLVNIPVIMQTSCSDRDEIRQGFKLGVYYYLVKPFAPPIFNAIVRSAINFYTKQLELISHVNDLQTLFAYVDNCSFNIKKLNDVKPISVGLARLFPNPQRVVLGISEILTNSIEHGNLGITYQEKTELNIEGRWLEEIELRLRKKENIDKRILILLKKLKNEIVLTVKDQGNGFDFEKYLDFDPSRSTDNHGRGIAFVRKECFDELEYVHGGNEVNCVVKTP